MDHALLHTPAQPTGDGFVLTHGAGGNCRSELLVAIANAFQKEGVLVLRYDLPFRQFRKFGPPLPARASTDREGLAAALSEMRAAITGKLFVGGHSYGGRQASILLSENPALADGLLLLSYPLHQPKKPEQLRTDHFSKLGTSALFVHGTNEPFGSIAEMRGAMPNLAGKARLSVVEGAGHDLQHGRFNIAEAIVKPFRELMEAR